MNYLKILGGVVVGLVIGYFVFHSSALFGATTTPIGGQNTSPKIAQQTLNTATDTVFSMLNTTGTDQTINSFDFFAYNGAATTSTYSLNCGTSTVASGISVTTSYIVGLVVSSNGNQTTNIGTTTGLAGAFVATSSPGLTGTTTSVTNPSAVNPWVRIWPNNTYLTCKTVDNTASANALNTLDTNTVGFIRFGVTQQ